MGLVEAKTKVPVEKKFLRKITILPPLNPFASTKLQNGITKHFDVRPNFTPKLCKTRHPPRPFRRFYQETPHKTPLLLPQKNGDNKTF